jgi:hypothetical protein
MASSLMQFCTKFQPLVPLQTTDSTTFFKFLHVYASICMQTLDLPFSHVLDSLPFSKSVSSPTKNCATCMIIFPTVYRVVFDKSYGFSLQTSHSLKKIVFGMGLKTLYILHARFLLLLPLALQSFMDSLMILLQIFLSRSYPPCLYFQ